MRQQGSNKTIMKQNARQRRSNKVAHRQQQGNDKNNDEAMTKQHTNNDEATCNKMRRQGSSLKQHKA